MLVYVYILCHLSRLIGKNGGWEETEAGFYEAASGVGVSAVRIREATTMMSEEKLEVSTDSP